MAAAALIRTGIPVISQRDDRSLRLLQNLLDGRITPSEQLDHWEKDWYRTYFSAKR